MSVDNSLGEAGDRISNMATRYVSAGASTLKVCACDYECISIREKEIPLYIYLIALFFLQKVRAHTLFHVLCTACRAGYYEKCTFMTVVIIRPQHVKATVKCFAHLQKHSQE